MIPRDSEYASLMPGFDQALAAVQRTPEYADLLAGLDPRSTGDTVTLDSRSGSELTRVFDRHGDPLGRTLRGTRARVDRWPSELSDRTLVLVKVENGPFRGRVVKVDARDVVLESAS